MAAILGVRQAITSEAQAAIELESIAEETDHDIGSFEFEGGTDGGPIVVGPAPVIRAVADALRRGERASTIAGRFHESVAGLVVQLAELGRARSGAPKVALSGGVFQNMLLLRRSVEKLGAAGFEVLTHRLAPANDGGIALGQAVVASLSAGTRD